MKSTMLFYSPLFKLLISLLCLLFSHKQFSSVSITWNHTDSAYCQKSMLWAFWYIYLFNCFAKKML